jgi:RHS repeat-associated protein
VYLQGSLLAEDRLPLVGSTETITYQHTDALGTPVATTNASKAVLQTSEYEPYGKLLNRPMEDGPDFTGHVSDAGSKLVYMQQRYYDPRTGRFWSTDPVTAYEQPIATFNRYRYANDNPYKFTDPDGRDSVGEMIDKAAEGCGAITCAGWAAAGAAWKMFGAEGISQIADKGWSSASNGDRANAVLEVASVLPVAKIGEGAKIVAKEAVSSLGFARSQLQHAFSHAENFGVVGNANNQTLAAFSSAIQAHVDNIGTMAIEGTYRKNIPVTHFVNPTTGLNVMKDSSGNFLSGWKLSEQQLEHVLKDGKLGGGQ